MCLSVTGKVLSIKGKKAVVGIGKMKKEVSCEFAKVKVGDNVLLYSGYIIEKVRK
jgi:hydrogenase maturation factor